MRRLASVVLTGVLLTACNGDPFSPEGVSGTYNLESINGNPLPELSIDGSLAMAGSITLNADGSMSFSITWDDQTESWSGTFTLVAPSTVRPDITGEEPVSATLDGDRLTIVAEDGDTFVFRK